MLRPDHPNARWLADLYGRSAELANDESLDPQERERQIAAHQATVMERLSPNMVVHTGGVRLAAVGDVAFLRAYGRRRTELGSASSTPVEIYQVLADDHYGIIYARVRSERAETVWERPAMGAWRFEDGLAVEHWELPNGPAWDEFYLAVDASLVDGDAHEYWMRSAD